MPFARRLLLVVLAALPVVWGNCPYWFAGDGCGDSATGSSTAHGARRACPCCRRKDDATRPGSPAPLKGDCDDCPMTVARRGSMPVPPSIELPDADPAVIAIVALPAANPPAGTATSGAIARPPGAPPDPWLLSTVVLTI